MRFYTQQHKYYCGIDLHARRMYICIRDATGEIVVHRNDPARPQSSAAPSTSCSHVRRTPSCRSSSAEIEGSAKAAAPNWTRSGPSATTMLASHTLAVTDRHTSIGATGPGVIYT